MTDAEKKWGEFDMNNGDMTEVSKKSDLIMISRDSREAFRSRLFKMIDERITELEGLMQEREDAEGAWGAAKVFATLKELQRLKDEINKLEP